MPHLDLVQPLISTLLPFVINKALARLWPHPRPRPPFCCHHASCSSLKPSSGAGAGGVTGVTCGTCVACNTCNAGDGEASGREG